MKCPCGCGRRVSRADGKLAERALFIRSLCDGLQMARHLGAAIDAPSEDLDGIDLLIQRGEYFDRAFLILAHGAVYIEASFRLELPDIDGGEPIIEESFGVNEPDRWVKRSLEVITLARAVDPRPFSTWVPY
jgi:hypothetical protein